MSALADATGTSRHFASRVVRACRAGTEGELYRRRRRRDAVGTELLQELEDFLLMPRISRCCPGESVSVGYGRQKEKHRMKVSKETALKEFQATQQSTYAVSTLLQYWPRNFVVPSSHDRQRNVCPVHDNWPRLIEALHDKGVGEISPPPAGAPLSCASVPVARTLWTPSPGVSPVPWVTVSPVRTCLSAWSQGWTQLLAFTSRSGEKVKLLN